MTNKDMMKRVKGYEEETILWVVGEDKDGEEQIFTAL